MKRFFALNSTHIHLCLNLLLIFFIGACKKNDLVLYTPKPTPDFKYTLSSDKLTATFKDSSINAGSWFWNFGDGSTATAQNPSAHTFTANPITSRDTTYFVKLIITNVEKTRKDSIVKPVVIGTAKIPPTDNRIIVGSTEYGFLNKKVETIISFGGDTKNAIGCRFDWDFGPGEDTAANTQVTRHSFKHTGNYTVTLTITSPSGGVAQVSQPVHVDVYRSAILSEFSCKTQAGDQYARFGMNILIVGTPIITSGAGADIGWFWSSNNSTLFPATPRILIEATPIITIFTGASAANANNQLFQFSTSIGDLFNLSTSDKNSLLAEIPTNCTLKFTNIDGANHDASMIFKLQLVKI